LWFAIAQPSHLKLSALCTNVQRLAGATLLVFANKQDLPGALSAEDIKEV